MKKLRQHKELVGNSQRFEGQREQEKVAQEDQGVLAFSLEAGSGPAIEKSEERIFRWKRTHAETRSKDKDQSTAQTSLPKLGSFGQNVFRPRTILS